MSVIFSSGILSTPLLKVIVIPSSLKRGPVVSNCAFFTSFFPSTIFGGISSLFSPCSAISSLVSFILLKPSITAFFSSSIFLASIRASVLYSNGPHTPSSTREFFVFLWERMLTSITAESICSKFSGVYANGTMSSSTLFEFEVRLRIDSAYLSLWFLYTAAPLQLSKLEQCLKYSTHSFSLFLLLSNASIFVSSSFLNCSISLLFILLE